MVLGVLGGLIDLWLDLWRVLQAKTLTGSTSDAGRSSIRTLSNEADANLQDCFASTDWNMFWDSSNNIEEFTTSVTGFINTELKARAAASKE